jgi:2-dehydro-3-deoxyphosphogluconate aldolase/(4S)-4-hydroxy-2-oxoglutarate aldolase
MVGGGDAQVDAYRRVVEIGVLPVVRLEDLSAAREVTSALGTGGVPVVEFPLTNPDAVDAVRAVRASLPEILVGAGTVLDAESARFAILAGAQFLVTPALRPDVIAVGLRYGAPTFCGAMSPTEILTAWEAGAACIKIFPASTVGPDHFAAVREPLPQIPLMPSGGVSLENAATFMRAGAVAVSVGGQLVSRQLVETKDWDEIARRARAFREAVQSVREKQTEA